MKIIRQIHAKLNQPIFIKDIFAEYLEVGCHFTSAIETPESEEYFVITFYELEEDEKI